MRNLARLRNGLGWSPLKAHLVAKEVHADVV